MAGIIRLHKRPPLTVGSLFTWGNNDSYQLGTGNNTPTNSPVAVVGSKTDWKFTGGVVNTSPYTLFGIRAGKLFGWGSGAYYILGNGDHSGASISSPIQIGSETDWISVWSGLNSAFGIRRGASATSGYLFAWGVNGDGRLGDGTLTTRSSPVQIGAENDWSRIVGTGYDCALGIQGGKLFGWGVGSPYSASGHTFNCSSPVQVGSDADWTAVGVSNLFGVGIRGGRLFSWGYGPNGELGRGTSGPTATPGQIGTETTWTDICVLGSSAMAIREGKLFAWGYNSKGLGNGTTNCNSPVQVGTATDWTAITGAQEGAGGIRGGKLYRWGEGASGQGGWGSAGSSATPVQIGLAEDWIACGSGSRNGCGIRGAG
jgi:alpha-tubulin suppressor-like RCC1 family protein